MSNDKSRQGLGLSGIIDQILFRTCASESRQSSENGLICPGEISHGEMKSSGEGSQARGIWWLALLWRREC